MTAESVVKSIQGALKQFGKLHGVIQCAGKIIQHVFSVPIILTRNRESSPRDQLIRNCSLAQRLSADY